MSERVDRSAQTRAANYKPVDGLMEERYGMVLAILTTRHSMDGTAIRSAMQRKGYLGKHPRNPFGPGTMQKVLAAMEANGLVERQAHSNYVKTQAGIEWMEKYYGS